MSDFLNIKITTKNNVLTVDNKKLDLGKRITSRLGDRKILKKDEEVLAKMIRDKISSNIARGLTYTGKPVRALAQSTIKAKGFSRPLYDTGKMLLGVIVAKEGNSTVVRMKRDKYPKRGKSKKSAPTVAQVAGWVNEGTSNMPSRPFFGITKKDLTNFAKIVIKEKLFK